MKKSKWPDFLFTIAVRFLGGSVLGCIVLTYRGILRAFSHNHTHWPLIWLGLCGLAGGIIAVCTTPYWQTPWYKGIRGRKDRIWKKGNCSGVGQTSGLPVRRASGPEFRRHRGHGAGGSVNRQTGGLPHTPT